MIGLPDLVKERKLSKIVINRRLPNIYYYIQGWTQRGCLRGGGGGALQAEDLNQAAQFGAEGCGRGMEGGLIGGGFGGAPPKFFLKSMSLRMHFKPF